MEKEHLEALLEDISGKLQLLAEGNMALVARFDGVDRRFDGVDRRFDGVDRRFDGVEGRLDKMDARFDRVDAELRLTRGDVAAIAGTVGDHEQRMTKLEKRRR